MTELRPCPFCGGKAYIAEPNKYVEHPWVECTVCHSKTNGYNTVEQAKEAWNGREEYVKHGHWEIAKGYARPCMCDQCFKMAYEPSSYCPECGARMDGEQDA